MASSGTVGATIYRVADLVDSIARSCGVKPNELTPDGIDVVMGALWRFLAHMSNRGINLWRVYETLFPLVQGQQWYDLNQGDIDVLKMMHRQPIVLGAQTITSSAGGSVDALVDQDLSTSCQQSAPNGNLVFDWGTGVLQQVKNVGVNSAGAASLTLVFEVSNDNLAWTQVYAPGAVAYAAGGWRWYEIDPPGVPARYFRIRETGGATLNLAEVSLASQCIDVEISSIDRDQWAVWPNKFSQGAPRQYHIDRQMTPRYALVLVPNAAEAFYCVKLWLHRHIEDVGQMSNTLNIPERWYQAIVDTVSWSVLPELPGADLQRAPLLEKRALAVTLPDAEKEERERGPVTLTPNIGVYTR